MAAQCFESMFYLVWYLSCVCTVIGGARFFNQLNEIQLRIEEPVSTHFTVPGPDISFWKKEKRCTTHPPSEVGSLPRVSGRRTESR